MDSSARLALKNLIGDSFFKLYKSLIKSKEVGSEFYSMMIKLQKGTEKDLEVVKDKYTDIFINGLEEYKNKNHVIKYGDIPHEDRKNIAINSIYKSIKEWTKEKK